MSLSLEQWFQRLKAWVPGWMFEDDDGISEALFYAMARLLSQMEEERAELLLQTFIDTAENPFLDLLGDERSVEKLPGESNASYRLRIRNRNTSSKSSYPEINTIAQEALTVDVIVREDFSYGVFCDRLSFFNRQAIYFDWIENGGFSIIVDNFSDPEEMSSMVESINRNKAFGVLYRVIERYSSSEIESLLEDGETWITEEGNPVILE